MGVLFRIVLISAVSYYVWKLLGSFFSPKKGNANRESNPRSNFNSTRKSQQKKGDSIIPDSAGEYIEYEEVD